MKDMSLLVHERMSSPPVTITLDTSLQDALKIVYQLQCQRLLVVDEKGRPIGLVSRRDLPYASSSPTESLSIFELHYRLCTLHVQDIMTDGVVTTLPDTSLKDAARLMEDTQSDCLAVVSQDGRVVGAISRTDFH